MSGRDVLKADVVLKGTKNRNARADDDWNPSDSDPIDQAGSKKRLNGPPTVDVHVLDVPLRQVRDDLLGCTGDMFYHGTGRSGRQGTSAEDEDGLVTVRPRSERERGFIGLPTHHHRVNGCKELVIAVWFGVLREEVEGPIRSGNEAIEACSDEDRGSDACSHVLPSNAQPRAAFTVISNQLVFAAPLVGCSGLLGRPPCMQRSDQAVASARFSSDIWPA